MFFLLVNNAAYINLLTIDNMRMSHLRHPKFTLSTFHIRKPLQGSSNERKRTRRNSSSKLKDNELCFRRLRDSSPRKDECLKYRVKKEITLSAPTSLRSNLNIKTKTRSRIEIQDREPWVRHLHRNNWINCHPHPSRTRQLRIPTETRLLPRPLAAQQTPCPHRTASSRQINVSRLLLPSEIKTSASYPQRPRQEHLIDSSPQMVVLRLRQLFLVWCLDQRHLLALLFRICLEEVRGCHSFLENRAGLGEVRVQGQAHT
jgi:hypothetical protein